MSLTREEKIQEVKKLTGKDEKLSWSELCKLTEFDSFSTVFAFGFNWNKNCPNDVIANFDEKYLNMIIFNVANHPKKKVA